MYVYIIPVESPLRYRLDGAKPSKRVGRYMARGGVIEFHNVDLSGLRVFSLGGGEVRVIRSDRQLSYAEVLGMTR